MRFAKMSEERSGGHEHCRYPCRDHRFACCCESCASPDCLTSQSPDCSQRLQHNNLHIFAGRMAKSFACEQEEEQQQSVEERHFLAGSAFI